MSYNITIYTNPDIESALESYTLSGSSDVVVRKKATSYSQCLNTSLRNRSDILILQVFSPIARAQDLMYDLERENYTSPILLFQVTEPGKLRYATSDQSKNAIIGHIEHFFLKALEGKYLCHHECFRTTIWDDNIQHFIDSAGRKEALMEILRGCNDSEFLVHRKRHNLNLKGNGYYLYFCELMEIEYNNHLFYKDIYNFIGEVLVQECYDVIDTYNGGEVLYCSLILLCIIVNDLDIKSEGKKAAAMNELTNRLASVTSCKTASRHLSEQIQKLSDLRSAYEQYHIDKPLAFFVRDLNVMRPSILSEYRTFTDRKIIDELLYDICSCIRYDISSPKLEESLRTLYFSILKPSLSYTLLYSTYAVIDAAIMEVKGAGEDYSGRDAYNPYSLRFSSIEDHYNVLLARILELSSSPANKTKTKNLIVLKVIDYITENFNQNISITDIANALYVSNIYLSQIFKNKMGVSVIKYLIHYRIDRAKELLIETDDPIYVISEKVGFNEFRYFSKTFKKTVGKTPMQFRKQG